MKETEKTNKSPKDINFTLGQKKIQTAIVIQKSDYGIFVRSEAMGVCGLIFKHFLKQKYPQFYEIGSEIKVVLHSAKRNRDGSFLYSFTEV